MAIESFNQLNEVHIDVLKEIGNIGAGNAATSLSKLLNREVDMVTPAVRILDISEADRALGGPETPVVAILVKLRGDIGGMMMFVIEREFTQSLLETLLGESRVSCGNLSEMESSALSEIGNIMIGAYAASVATLSGLVIKTTVPAVTVDMAGALLTVPAAEMGSVSDKIIFIEDDFLSASRTISANMMLIPDLKSLNKLMESLGIQL